MGVKILGMKLDFMFEEDTTLSGHKSRTQKQIGTCLIFLKKIAGKPIVIGDDSKTNMISIFLCNRKNDVKTVPIT